jgi:DNA-binding transcriptional MerR regulator
VTARIRREERFLRPGELARLAGVSVDTLRHYERKGLLSPRRRANRYREYREDAFDRVRLIQRALSVGFSLDDLARILKERDSGGAPCRKVRQLAEAKLADIERLIDDLSSVREELRLILTDWDARLERAGDRPARLLEALAATPMNGLKIQSRGSKARGSKQSALGAATFRKTQRQRRRNR